MPGQEKLVIVDAGDWQRQAVDACPALVTAIVADCLGLGDSTTKVGKLTRGHTARATPVAE